jgi:hypothetical protein
MLSHYLKKNFKNSTKTMITKLIHNQTAILPKISGHIM